MEYLKKIYFITICLTFLSFYFLCFITNMLFKLNETTYQEPALFSRSVLGFCVFATAQMWKGWVLNVRRSWVPEHHLPGVSPYLSCQQLDFFFFTYFVFAAQRCYNETGDIEKTQSPHKSHSKSLFQVQICGQRLSQVWS